MHVANIGNALVKPTGRATIFNSKGVLVETLPFTMDTFLPQTAIDYPILLKKALAAGDYVAAVTLRVPGGQTVLAKPSFSVSQADVKQVFTSASPTQPPPTLASSSSSSTPWPLIGAAAGGLLVVLLLLLWLLRRRRDTPAAALQSVLAAAAAEESSLPEPPPAPETAVPAMPAEPIAPIAPAEPVPAPAPPPPAPAGAERPAACRPYHFWEVAYDRGRHTGAGAGRLLYYRSAHGD